MKKSKLANIVVLGLSILFCIISFIMAFTCEETSVKDVFIKLMVVSLISLIAALVMVILSKKKLFMIPMLVIFLNAFLTCNMLSSILISLADSGTISDAMGALDFVVIALAILGIVFTCLKHKWGAIVGIVGVAFMIYTQDSLICGLTTIGSEDLEPYAMLSWTAAAVLFQFVWLLVPMISLLCEKKQNEEVPQVEEKEDVKEEIINRK